MSDPAPYAAAARRSVVRSAGVVVVLFAAFALVPLRGDRWWVGMLVGTALLATMIPLAVVRLRRVLASERPGFEASEALIQLLTMLITGFAAVYYAMNRDGTQLTSLDTRVDAVYFTVTTLSTVGFGDVAATSQAARLVVTVQIVFDLLFIGVAVRVFAMAARRRAEERRA